ncbi:UNVERIFIED_CONTAM: Elongator complex protein 5, partial [Eudyptes pachyrhynchus]
RTPVVPPARPSRLLALLHGDLHPPGLLRALGALASTQLTLGGPPPGPGAPRLVSVLSRPRRGGGTQKDESFTLLPDGSLRSLGTPPPAPEEEEGRGTPAARTPGSPGDSGIRAPPAPLTFRLRLSAAERAARAAVPPPYQLSPPRRSTLLRTPGTVVCAPEPPEDEDPEDPDDDLDV